MTTHSLPRNTPQLKSETQNRPNKERCPGCMQWRSEWALSAVYYPYPTRIPIRYKLCKSCARKVLARGRAARKLTLQVESYFGADVKAGAGK